MIVDEIVEAVHTFKVLLMRVLGLLRGLKEVTGLVVVPILLGLGRYISARTVNSVYTVLRVLGSVDKLGAIPFSSGGDINEAYIIATQLQ